MPEVLNLVLDDAHGVTPRAPDLGPAACNPEPVAAGDEEKRAESASVALSQIMPAATPKLKRDPGAANMGFTITLF
jgi:hypothetical protein